MRLREYARKRSITYDAAWRHYKNGKLLGKKLKDGSLSIKGEARPIVVGRPKEWDKERVLREVFALCKGRYVKANEFPSYLYELAVRLCGSVRAAKWEAKIIHGRHWRYEKFIKCVQQFCLPKYRENAEWPPNMRALARQFSGSIRKAKWEAGVIQDKRRRVRGHPRDLEALWTKEKFLRWLHNFCEGAYKKPSQWPGYMRELAVRYCGSARAAKFAAKILKDQRKKSR